jgi:hypothetical protein
MWAHNAMQHHATSLPDLAHLYTQGDVVPAEEEEVLPAELREAWFTVLKAAHRGKPRPGPYFERRASCIGLQLEKIAQIEARYTEKQQSVACHTQWSPAIDAGVMHLRYKQWLLHGMPAVEAYSERAAAYTAAKAFLQARADAAAALRLLGKPDTAGNQVCADGRLAYICLRFVMVGQRPGVLRNGKCWWQWGFDWFCRLPTAAAHC